MKLEHTLTNGDLVTYYGKNYQVCDLSSNLLPHKRGCYAMTLISPRGKFHVNVPHEKVELVLWTGKRNPKVAS